MESSFKVISPVNDPFTIIGPLAKTEVSVSYTVRSLVFVRQGAQKPFSRLCFHGLSGSGLQDCGCLR